MRRRIHDDVESGAQKQQREYFLRKQMESIRKELGEDDGSVIDEYRKKIDETELPEAVREQAERELSRLERMGESSAESSMIRSYLEWIFDVPWGEDLRGAPRPEAGARDPRRRPRGPRRREGAHRRVPRRPQAAPGARHRGRQEVGRDPDPDRPARHRQDVDRRVDRPRAQPRVRPHVARRHPRRGRDPRPPAHLHRRAARAGSSAPCATPGR